MTKLQKILREFTRKRGWDKQLPDQVAKSISIEAAELLELFQWVSPTAEEIRRDKEKLTELSGELADVMIYSLQMALLLGLDADKIIKEKLKFADKKYPVKLVRIGSDNDSFATAEYLRIKKEHRLGKKKSNG
jgi:NTP pyrophosphatase (non-canonical NTP hydrolase)